jgi:hypothetical protein
MVMRVFGWLSDWLQPHIAELLQLKAKYKTETGEEFGNPPLPSKADKKAEKKAAKPAQVNMR